MPRSSNDIDFSKLLPLISATHKLADVKHKLVTVAFDIVRFRDQDPEELWQIQNSDDGDYIVARYENPSETEELPTKTASASPWEVSIDDKKHLHIFYKNYQVAKLKASTLGLENADLDTVKRYLPNKLASDQSLVNSLLNTLSQTEKYHVCRTFPELQKA
jgi:hypothetical protein